MMRPKPIKYRGSSGRVEFQQSDGGGWFVLRAPAWLGGLPLVRPLSFWGPSATREDRLVLAVALLFSRGLDQRDALALALNFDLNVTSKLSSSWEMDGEVVDAAIEALMVGALN